MDLRFSINSLKYRIIFMIEGKIFGIIVGKVWIFLCKKCFFILLFLIYRMFIY